VNGDEKPLTPLLPTTGGLKGETAPPIGYHDDDVDVDTYDRNRNYIDDSSYPIYIYVYIIMYIYIYVHIYTYICLLLQITNEGVIKICTICFHIDQPKKQKAIGYYECKHI
jgi:hypothetical protein